MTLRRPQTDAVAPVQRSVTGKWAEALVNLATAILAIMVVAAAGLLFVLFVILRRALMTVWLPIERAVSVIVYAIVGLVLTLVDQIIGLLVIGAITGGLVYLALETSPTLKAKIYAVADKVQQSVHTLTGIQFRIPTLHEAMDALTSRGPGDNPNPLHPANIEAQVKELERLKDVRVPDIGSLQIPGVELPPLPNFQMPEIPNAAALQDIVGKKELPKELMPLLGVTMQPQMLAGFKMLAESGALKKGPDAALPLLQHGLYSPDPALSSASIEALAGIQSPEAKKMLLQYQQVITKVLNDAARHQNTGR